MKRGIVLQTFLVDGNPAGLRIVTIKNRTGKTLAITHNNLANLLKREECTNPGV